MRIYGTRHCLSAGNEDINIHNTHADHAIPAASVGWEQSYQTGLIIAKDLETNLRGTRVRVWNSPYLRTRTSRDGIIEGIMDYYNRKPFFTLDSREDIRLCEQQFGLFDGIPDEELPVRFPEEFAHYKKCQDQGGRFWARMPLGESRFDVTVRVKETFGTWHRDAEKKGIETIIVICHGVTLRALFMGWLHLTPEWFDAEPNPKNMAVRVIDRGPNHHEDFGYLFEGYK